ncbi:MAG: pseudouridine synthase, partial [Bilophila sp.]
MEKTTVRINKALADAGVCSRRRADELVAAGVVRVNGEVVASAGMQVRPGIDTIEVQGKALAAPCAEPCYLLLHKPIQVVSTAYDPEGRTTVLDLVPEAWQNRRLYPAGRLDFFSEGLVLLTDDGELTHRLVHPSHHLPRVYQVLVRGTVSEQTLDIMRKGMTLEEGETLAPVEVRILPGSLHDLSGQQEQTPAHVSGALPPAGQSGTLLELTLHQG